ncbi:MAG TPA: hypothetical protein VMX75_06605 [Spirochaetia bacterium]|nr:hypothetical protein [Spirochaetia bacterium]
MEKTRNLALSIGGIAAALLIIVLIVLNLGPVSIKGNYVAKIGNRYPGVNLRVEENQTTVIFMFEGPNGLSALYSVPRSKNSRYSFDESSGTGRTAHYELQLTKKGISGKIWVLPAGELDITFEKKK